MISNWLLIDQRPFKHYVLNQCSKWGNLYKEHLLHYVLNSLNVSCVVDDEDDKIFSSLMFDGNVVTHSFSVLSFLCNELTPLGAMKDLDQFIESSDKILSLVFEWDDFGALLKIMTVLKSIAERETGIEAHFQSLKRIIYMLLQYNVRVPKKCSFQVSPCTRSLTIP